MKISELQDKAVVNINDGKNVGKIYDLEIDNEGKVLNFYTMPKRIFWAIFSSNKETIFTINDIKKIGKDVILVEID